MKTVKHQKEQARIPVYLHYCTFTFTLNTTEYGQIHILPLPAQKEETR